MQAEPNEYSLAELLDHPGLGLMITSGGIERRGLELMLDAKRYGRRGAADDIDGRVIDQRAAG